MTTKTRVIGAFLGASAWAAVLALGACSDPAGPDGTERVGVVQWYATAADLDGSPSWPAGEDVVIEAPSTVTAGVPFDATVTTVGNHGCFEAERTDVANQPSLAEIRPVDRDGMTEGIACTAATVELQHPVELVFSEVGEATIRVVGRLVVGDDFSQGEELVVERTVTVTAP